MSGVGPVGAALFRFSNVLRVFLLVGLIAVPLFVNALLMWIRTNLLGHDPHLMGGVGTGLSISGWGVSMSMATSAAAFLAWKHRESAAFLLVAAGALGAWLHFWPGNYPRLGYAHVAGTIFLAGMALLGLHQLKASGR